MRSRQGFLNLSLSHWLRQRALLVVADAGVVPAPPIGATSDAGTSQQPITIIAIGVIIRSVHPYPSAVAEHAVAMPVMVVKVAVSLGKMPAMMVRKLALAAPKLSYEIGRAHV